MLKLTNKILEAFAIKYNWVESKDEDSLGHKRFIKQTGKYRYSISNPSFISENLSACLLVIYPAWENKYRLFTWKKKTNRLFDLERMFLSPESFISQ